MAIRISWVLLVWMPVCLPAHPAIGAPSGVPRASATVADWRAAIDAIVCDIRLLHPDPFTRVGRTTFLRQAEALKVALPSLTPEQRVVGAMRMVATLGDGHTQLEPIDPTFAHWYPIRLYEFTDGYFVTSAHESVADLAGAQVLEIAGRPVAEVVDAARDLMGADNAFGRMERLYVVHSAGLMKGLGFAGGDGELAVKVKLRDGRIARRSLRPSRADHPDFRPDDATFEWQFRSEIFGLPFGTDDDWLSAYRNIPSSAFRKPDLARPPRLTDQLPYGARALPEHGAYYIRTSQVSDTDFVPFFRTALHEVDSLKPRRLILDWRDNFGGDGSKLALMIDEFIKRGDARPWRELYILTGRRTFSAAVMALDALIEHTDHTIVGEPAGSALNHFGDATSRIHERVGLKLSVSTLRHQLASSDDLSELIPVDVPAPSSFLDYAAGRDPAVDPILRGDEVRSIPVIALSDGGAAARTAYGEQRRRFARHGWWMPPGMIALRQASQRLREQKRMEDAVETCRLNAEIHPFIWNVWLNLGIALRASGFKKEGLACYRCVLEIDPNNFNGQDIRDLLAKEDPGGTVGLAPGCPTGR